MTIKTHKISLTSKKQFEVINITDEVKSVVATANISDGLAVVYAPHTTASVRLNHDEPLLLQDIMKMLYRVAPVDLNYSHDLFERRTGVEANERSNGHAHVKAFLLGSSESIPVQKSQLVMGEKQSIFFVELDGGRERSVVVQVLGE